MYRIVRRENLNPTVTLFEVEAPAVARHAKPGQFVILRADENGERIPLTVADADAARGTVTVIFQVVGATTEKLNRMPAGECLSDFVGPLGKPTDLSGLTKVAVVGGGVGSAIAFPIAKALFERGAEVDAVVGFRTRDLVILEKEFRAHATRFFLVSDDGTTGEKGLVTDVLDRLLASGERYDEVITVGPLPMMKFVAQVTKKYGVKTVASMNPIMIDGTGMCGGCRLTVGGETKFACVDGPDFDAHLIDFDAAIERASMYRNFERQAREKACNLFREV